MLLNKPMEALPCVEKAFSLDPSERLYFDFVVECRLRIGDLRRGFEMLVQFERFSECAPQWDGFSSLVGLSIVINAEFGLGDVIQFARYFRLLKEARGAGRVILHMPLDTHHRLLGLIETAPGLDEVCRQVRPPDADFYAPLFSLPGLFKTDVGTIPARLPYLFPSQPELDWIRSYSSSCGFKVGLCWQASVKTEVRWNERCIPSQYLAPLMNLPGVSIYNLQGGEARRDSFPGSNSMRDLSGFPQTLRRDAALISEMDLILTCDTVIAHLAGALGKRTWVMLPYSTDWRWAENGENGENSAWYPGVMKLYRQEQPGDWAAVIDRVRRDLLDHSRLH